MRSFYDSCTEFVPPEQTARSASSEKTRIFSWSSPWSDRFSVFCWRIPVSQQRKRLNITRAPPLDYDLCRSPQRNALGTLALYRPYAEGTHGGPLGEKQPSDWFRYQRPCIQSTLDRIQQCKPLIHCFPCSDSPLGMVDILHPGRLKSQTWFPPLLGSQSGVQRIPFLDQ